VSETHAERIDRLTTLARKAWPDKPDVCILAPGVNGCEEWGACVVSDPDGDWAQLLCCDGPRALDAIEAALCTLAMGESYVIVEVGTVRGWEERAEKAEKELAELRAKLVEHAERWEDWADVPVGSALSPDSLARQFAHELRDAAKGNEP
jgi:hypothetical protein